MHRCTAVATALMVAFVLPSAVAAGLQATHPDDRAGALGVGSTTVATPPDALDRYLADRAEQTVASSTANAAAARPDNRAGVLGVSAAETVAGSTTSSGSGFDWRDAGIGAAAAAILLLLGGWIVAELRLHRGGRGGLLPH